jgi:hypothetical protein
VFTQRYFGATDIAPSRGDGSRMSKKQQHLIPQKQAAFLAGLRIKLIQYMLRPVQTP